MELTPFLLLDAVFLVGLIWWFWTRAERRARNAEPEPEPEAVAIPGLPVRSILFSGNSATLPRAAITDLDALAAWLKATEARLELTGSADDSGHLTQNRKLAQSRASIALRALLAHGIPADRLVVRTIEPAHGATEAERQALRCVRFRVLEGR